MLFQSYIYSAIDNICHPYIVDEFKSNMYKESSEDNHYKGVYIPSKKSKLSQSMNVDYWMS